MFCHIPLRSRPAGQALQVQRPIRTHRGILVGVRAAAGAVSEADMQNFVTIAHELADAAAAVTLKVSC